MARGTGDGGDVTPPDAHTIRVTTSAVNNDDDGECSLLEAISASNTRAAVNTGDCSAGTGHDIIQLPAGTFEIPVALALVKGVEIAGIGRGATTLSFGAGSGTNTGCGVQVAADVNVVRLADLTLSGAGAPSNALTGVCVTDGSLWLRRVRVTGFGGGALRAVAVEGGHAGITLLNSLIDRNRNSNDGGGIWFGDNSRLFVEQSAIVNNTSDGAGGGVYASGAGTNTIKNTTISGNSARWGGGIAIEIQDRGYMALYSATVAYNHATEIGGGLFQRLAPNATVNTILNGDIVTNNTAATDATQGNLNAEWGSNFSCSLSLLYVATLARRPPNVMDSCRYDVPDALLGPLMNMGGTEGLPVHALLPGSPAIDAIDATNSGEIIQQRDSWNGVAGDPQIGSGADDTPAWTLFPKPADGDGDGTADEDMGAYEVNPRWETELLAVADVSAGAHAVVTTPVGFSHGAGTHLAASAAAGAFVTYTVPFAQAGSFDVVLGMKLGPDAAQFQVTVADAVDGAYAAVGSTQDGYAATDTWRELSVGRVLVSSTGPRYFRLTVTGKNTFSAGFQLFPDYIAVTRQ